MIRVDNVRPPIAAHCHNTVGKKLTFSKAIAIAEIDASRSCQKRQQWDFFSLQY